MKNLLRIFELTQRDQRVVVLIMIVLLVVMFAQRFRHSHPQSTRLTSQTVSTAQSQAADEQTTADNGP
jgi:hypothetical protein